MRYEVRKRGTGKGIWDKKTGRWANGTIYSSTRKVNSDARKLEMENLGES